MIISNFRNLQRIPSKHFRTLESLVADVDVTTKTGFPGFRKTKTETRKVFREEVGINWMWLETGEWTPSLEVEKLFKAYEIKERLNG